MPPTPDQPTLFLYLLPKQHQQLGIQHHMQLFHLDQLDGNTGLILDQEAKHMTQVLRKKLGDRLNFTDGKGHHFRGVIVSVAKKKVEVEITETNFSPNPTLLHLAIAPTKNIARIEWLVEKVCEMGVREISFLQTRHSERKAVKMERLAQKVQSACLQSLKFWYPTLHPMRTFERCMKEEAFLASDTQRFIAYCGAENLPLLKDQLSLKKEVLLLIGPEGDFSPAEFAQAEENGFTGISLGQARLRTETAGLVASALIQQLNL